MKRMICMLIIVSFLIPVRAYSGMVGTPDPVEKSLTETLKSQQDLLREPATTDSQKMTEDFQKDMQKTDQPVKTGDSSTGSSSWKWVLGILLIGGIATAAGGGGEGGSSGGSTPGSGGTVTTTW